MHFIHHCFSYITGLDFSFAIIATIQENRICALHASHFLFCFKNVFLSSLRERGCTSLIHESCSRVKRCTRSHINAFKNQVCFEGRSVIMQFNNNVQRYKVNYILYFFFIKKTSFPQNAIKLMLTDTVMCWM